MQDKNFEYYLEQAQLTNEGFTKSNIINSAFVIAAFASALGISKKIIDRQDDIKKEAEQEGEAKQLNFKHGKHNVVVRIGGSNDIIYTSKGNEILILVPETMDKDDALQQVEDIVMKIKQKDNIK